METLKYSYNNNSDNMVGEKESSWGIDPTGEEGIKREIEETAGVSAASRGYFDSSLLSILAALTEEVRMIRCHLTGIEYEPLFNAEDLEHEEDEKPFDETRDVIPSSIPRNLNSEREIQDFYKSQLVLLMSDREAGNLEIMVEEDQVILKTGFVDRDRYGPLSAKLRDLGGDYIREEGNWHWIMPLP